MEPLGINYNLLLLQMFVGFGWIGFSVFSLLNLRSKNLSGITLAVWALTICAVPVLGALAYWIVRPQANTSSG